MANVFDLSLPACSLKLKFSDKFLYIPDHVFAWY